jgi:hypothetical protein
MAKLTNTSNFIARPRIKRPGVHSKKGTSSLKSSKNYKKLYRGQGN